MENQRVNTKAHNSRPNDDDHWDEVHNQMLAVQKKSMEVSKPGDPDEEEADEVTRKVMNGQSASISGSTSGLNRKGSGDVEASPEFQSKLQENKGGGQSLPNDLQKNMGSKMGADFSDVKVHTGGEAAAMSNEISAKAFTHGNDVYFNEGQYNPESKQGQELIAHELVHTRQQEKSVFRSELNNEYDRYPHKIIEVHKVPTRIRVTDERRDQVMKDVQEIWSGSFRMRLGSSAEYKIEIWYKDSKHPDLHWAYPEYGEVMSLTIQLTQKAQGEYDAEQKRQKFMTLYPAKIVANINPDAFEDLSFEGKVSLISDQYELAHGKMVELRDAQTKIFLDWLNMYLEAAAAIDDARTQFQTAINNVEILDLTEAKREEAWNNFVEQFASGVLSGSKKFGALSALVDTLWAYAQYASIKDPLLKDPSSGRYDMAEAYRRNIYRPAYETFSGEDIIYANILQVNSDNHSLFMHARNNHKKMDFNKELKSLQGVRDLTNTVIAERNINKTPRPRTLRADLADEVERYYWCEWIMENIRYNDDTIEVRDSSGEWKSESDHPVPLPVRNRINALLPEGWTVLEKGDVGKGLIAAAAYHLYDLWKGKGVRIYEE